MPQHRVENKERPAPVLQRPDGIDQAVLRPAYVLGGKLATLGKYRALVHVTRTNPRVWDTRYHVINHMLAATGLDQSDQFFRSDLIDPDLLKQFAKVGNFRRSYSGIKTKAMPNSIMTCYMQSTKGLDPTRYHIGDEDVPTVYFG
ncbi:hypothetical protein CIB48_g11284 [Xylaria polymorpha]|nr:hypothetical protein CIB48_g11284 [Xylaria polymorpha]